MIGSKNTVKLDETKFENLHDYYNELSEKILNQKRTYIEETDKCYQRLEEILKKSSDLERQIDIIIDEIRRISRRINRSNGAKMEIISHYNKCLEARANWNEQFRLGLIDKNKCHELNVYITGIMKDDKRAINHEDKQTKDLNDKKQDLNDQLAKLKNELKTLASEKKLIDKKLKNLSKNIGRCEDNLSSVYSTQKQADELFLIADGKDVTAGSLEPRVKQMKKIKKKKSKNSK